MMAGSDRSSCPVCGSTELSKTDGVPHPSCDDCGTFVDGNVDRDSLRRDDIGAGESMDKEWASYNKITNSTEKQVAVAIEKLEALADKLGLTDDTRSRAAEIYADAAIAGRTDGRSTEAIVATVTCLAAREVSDPRPIDHLAREADIPVSKLRRLLRVLQQELEYEGTVTEPSDFMEHLFQSTGTAQSDKQRAQALLDSAGSELTISGKHPASVAAAALYLESDSPVTQRELARAAGVTEGTVRVRVKEFREVSR